MEIRVNNKVTELHEQEVNTIIEDTTIKIKNKMEDEGMSKNKLAGITGMSSRTLQRVFNGPSTQKIPFATLVRIAHGLELEIVLKEEPSLKDYLSDRVCLA